MDRYYFDEAQQALGGLVVEGSDMAGVLGLSEASHDKVAEAVEGAIRVHAQLVGFSHGDHRHYIARLHGFSNIVRVITSIRQQDSGLGQGVVHEQAEDRIVKMSCPA